MLIIGAKGFAKQLLEIFCQLNELADLYFYDDVSNDLPERLYNIYPVLKTEEEVKELFKKDNYFALGIGNPFLRYKMEEKFTNIGGKLMTVISPYAHIGLYENVIEEGVNILTGVVIENNVRISKGSLINLNSTITHDTYIGKFSEISPGVHISGGCKIGDYCMLGTGAVLLPKVKLGDNVKVGAGAVVTKNVESNTVVAGIPARFIKKAENLKF